MYGLVFLWFGLSMAASHSRSKARRHAVGRPLTPVSVAGVARRQTRRAVWGTGIAGAAVVGTAAAVAAAPYYGGSGYHTGGPYASYTGYPGQDYATLNGFVCQPGSLTKLDDGRYYRCQ